MGNTASIFSASGSIGTPIFPEGLKINIATPCYGGIYSSLYISSFTDLLALWKTANVGYSFSEVDTADIEFSRNILISNFYFNKTDNTHILFIDPDVGFDANLVNRMIALKKDIVGVAASEQHLDYQQLHSAGELPFDKALAQAVNFPVDPVPDSSEIDGFIEVHSCSASILLISRACITKMINHCPEIVDRGSRDNFPLLENFEMMLAPFDRIVTQSERLADVKSFCHRWVEGCQGKIFANIDSSIKRAGVCTVESRFNLL